MNTKLLKTATALFPTLISHSTTPRGTLAPRSTHVQAARVLKSYDATARGRMARPSSLRSPIARNLPSEATKLALDKLLQPAGTHGQPNQQSPPALEIGRSAPWNKDLLRARTRRLHDAVTLSTSDARESSASRSTNFTPLYPTVALALTEAAAIHDLSPRDTQTALWILKHGSSMNTNELHRNSSNSLKPTARRPRKPRQGRSTKPPPSAQNSKSKQTS